MKRLVSWVEIPSKNFERAIKFYEKVFKVGLKVKQFENEKMACFENGEGAIIHLPGFKTSMNGVVVSFLVPDSIEETINRSKTFGGIILQDKTEIQRKKGGYFALIKDSEGNRIGLYNVN